jgi:hypothetical protein
MDAPICQLVGDVVAAIAIGMAGQVAYPLMAQAGMAPLGAVADHNDRVLPACRPVLVLVLVLATGTALAHVLRADAEAVDTRGAGPDSRPSAVHVLVSGTGPDRRGSAVDQDRFARRN